MLTSVFAGPDEIRIEQVEAPRPGPGEAVVGVRAAGICGGDLHEWRAGRQLYDVPYPRPAQGHELAGEVLAIGLGVTRVAPGDRVAVMPMVACGVCDACHGGRYALCPRLEHLGVARPGGFAEQTLAPAVNLHRLPAHVSYEEAALLDCVAVAVHAVHRVPPAGARVAVIGAGAIGLAVAQLARVAGAARVTVVGRRPGALALAREFGADATVDVTAGDPEPAGAADVVYETAGGAGLLQRAARLAAPGGAIGLVGEHFAPDPLDVPAAMARELTLAFVWSYGYHAGRDEFARALELVAAGRVRLAPAITHRVPLRDLARGFALAADREASGAVKVLVEPSRESGEEGGPVPAATRFGR